jgi:hypothetical protein
MITLAQINARYASTRTWGQYTLASRYVVGRNGHQNGRRGTAGAKLHLLRIEVVTAEAGEHKPGTYKVGQTFSTQGSCAANGQHTGVAMADLDTDKVTCQKCLRALGRIAAHLEAQS